MKYIIQMKKNMILWLNKSEEKGLTTAKSCLVCHTHPSIAWLLVLLLNFFFLFSGIAELSLLLHTCTNSNANV